MQAAAPKPNAVRRAHPGQGVPVWHASKWPNQRSYVENGERGLGRDHLYSVAALTNQAGAVVERYRYDTYGNRTTLAPDGITTRAVSSYNQQVGFTGRYLDKETGLWYFRSRILSSPLGIFLSRNRFGKIYGPNIRSGGRGSFEIDVHYDKEAVDTSDYIDGMNLYVAGVSMFQGLDPSGDPVTMTFDFSDGTLVAKDDDTGETVTIPKVYSGNGAFTNDPTKCYLIDQGPLPVGEYLVGNPADKSRDPGHNPAGDFTWFPLYGSNGSGGFSRTKIPVKDPTTGKTIYRGSFYLHVGRASNGCVTCYSDVDPTDPGYPKGKEWDKLKDLLKKTKPFVLKPGDTYKGKIVVKP